MLFFEFWDRGEILGFATEQVAGGRMKRRWPVRAFLHREAVSDNSRRSMRSSAPPERRPKQRTDPVWGPRPLALNIWSGYPESIREYREDERRQAGERKRTCRARRRLLNKSTRRRYLVPVHGYTEATVHEARSRYASIPTLHILA